MQRPTCDIYTGLAQNKSPAPFDHGCRCTTSMTEHPHTSVGTSHGIWMNSSLADHSALALSWTGPAFTEPHPLRVPCMQPHEKHGISTQGGHKIRITSANFWCRKTCYYTVILRKVARSLAKAIRSCIEDDSRHSEQSLQLRTLHNAITLYFSQEKRFLNKKLNPY
jgi:hypothetical protein